MTDEHGPDISTQRKYLPTLAELVDRMSIVQLKMIFIESNREAYEKERAAIEHDIDLLLCKRRPLFSMDLRAIMMIMLTNHTIWMNESKARAGGSDQDKLLKFTHSINGCRNVAKNILAKRSGERVDLKIDSLAADLPKEFGSWNVFNDA
jgi:hypothetical protein